MWGGRTGESQSLNLRESEEKVSLGDLPVSYMSYMHELQASEFSYYATKREKNGWIDKVRYLTLWSI